MSAISSVGTTTPTSSQLLQVLLNKQTSHPKNTVASQTQQSTGNDPDSDGDSDAAGVNKTA